MPIENDLFKEAQTIDRLLQVIRRETRRPIDSEISRTSLTAPQLQAMMILTQPEHLNGITLKELTRAVGLSQSTVSGIVERLERAGLVQRKADKSDRRFTRIEAKSGTRIPGC